jgi:hypothetical protein
MPHDLELIIALALPLAVLTLLRINAAIVFLSLCLGYVLVELVANDANSLISFLAPKADSLSRASWELILLFAPVILTSVIMLFSVKGRFKVTLNMLPAAATSVMAVLLAVPLFTPGLRFALQSGNLWHQLSSAQAFIVGMGALISLVFLWTSRSAIKGGSHKSSR